jgi:23S rRNA (guanosine2251-2'-O)-methyltransferase
MDVDVFRKSPKVPLILALDNIRSMNNIGSFFRTADAFRIEKVLLGGITAKPPHRDIRKTALGAEESVEWEYHEYLESGLMMYRNRGYQLIAMEQVEGAKILADLQSPSVLPAILIFGNEVEGVSQDIVDLCDHSYCIAQYGTKHSLNVSVSAGIAIWAFTQAYIREAKW